MKKAAKVGIGKNLKALATIAFVVTMFIVWWNFQSKKTTYPVEQVNTIDSVTKTCNRVTPYDKPAEFDRVLSLILQRQQQANHPYANDFKKMRNCLDITYTDLKQKNGAEGVFYFDSQVSTPDRLVLEVDRSYSVTDDITTAYLLSHELTHARQYLETISGKNWSCVDSEVEAFYEQLVFGSLLNEEESQSVITRLESGSQNTQLQQYEQLLDMSWNAIQACGLDKRDGKTSNDFSCWQRNVRQQLETMITSSDFYQEQCSEEL